VTGRARRQQRKRARRAAIRLIYIPPPVSGRVLERWAEMFATDRKSGESDKRLRKRLLKVITARPGEGT